MKQSTRDRIKKLYLYAKLAVVLIVVSAVTYGLGTFMPNPIAVKKATEETRIQHAIWAEKLGLHEPSFEYTNKKEFILEVNKCVDYLNWKTPPDKRVPIQMVTAQAALESGWGTSRFGIEANNLFVFLPIRFFSVIVYFVKYGCMGGKGIHVIRIDLQFTVEVSDSFLMFT